MINRLWRRFWFRPWVKKWYWLQIILGVICLDSILNGLKFAWKSISMHGPPSERVAKCAIPRKMRGPPKKCADPRKVRGLRYECGGRQVRGRARNAWAAVQLRGPHRVRGPQLRGEVSGPHLPLTCHSMPSQCNRGSTRLGRDEPQSPGTLRVNIKTVFPRYGIPMIKIRQSRDRLIFSMGIPILVRQHFYIETAPWSRLVVRSCCYSDM